MTFVKNYREVLFHKFSAKDGLLVMNYCKYCGERREICDKRDDK